MKYLILLSALILGACSSSSNVEQSSQQIRATDQEIYKMYATKCTYTDGKTPAPEWVCGYPIDQYNITEVGFSRRGIEEEAKAVALSKLAGRILTEVKTDVSASIQGMGRSEKRDFTSTSIQKVSQNLINTRVLLKQHDPLTGGMYILLVADEEAYQNAIMVAKLDNRM